MKALRVVKLLLVVFLTAMSSAQAVSLYQEGSYQSLTGDRKAYRTGDLITVLVYENASASSTANTTAGRDADMGFDVNGIGKNRLGGVKLNNDFDGSGRTLREGKVLAQITVEVKEVLSNGDMLIGGEQLLEVNNERQQIKVEGRVRRRDISEENTILSTRIADAKISYVGDGDLADRQRPGWWQRLLTWFGL